MIISFIIFFHTFSNHNNFHQFHHIMQEQADSESFNLQIQQAFTFYDMEEKGHLTTKEFRNLLNNMRKELNLYNIDNLLFDAITHLADKDRNGKFTYEKFHQNLEKILPKIMRPGEDMKNMLRKAFMDFDIDRSGTLEKNELKLWITLTCDLMKVERCSEWHIDYIISLIDDNGDLKID